MTYPINVGRNIAREAANSYYVLASDIELYPSPGLIPAFLKMITNANEEVTLKGSNSPRVFVLSVFEIKEHIPLPNTKKELLNFLKRRKVIPFHKWVCNKCHAVPKSNEWISDLNSTGTYCIFIVKIMNYSRA